MTARRSSARPIEQHERGSVTIEAVIVTPALLLFALVIIAAGRLALAHQTVELAAAEASRTATLSRSPAAAIDGATTAASQTLAARDLDCMASAIDIDTAALSRDLGAGAVVTARVTCTVNLSDVTVPGLPGRVSVAAVAESPVDRYRGR